MSGQESIELKKDSDNLPMFEAIIFPKPKDTLSWRANTIS